MVCKINEKEAYFKEDYSVLKELDDSNVWVWDYSWSVDYIAEINNISYIYIESKSYDEREKVWEEKEIYDWQKCSNEAYLSDFKYNFISNLENLDVYLKMGMSAYKYNEQKGVYEMSMTMSGTSLSMEVKFVEEELYSLEMKTVVDIQEEGELHSLESIMTYTFAPQEIDLPEQDKLNAVVESTERLSLMIGTYKFESLTENGVMYEIGDTYDGVVLTEDYSTIILKKNGKGSMSLQGNNVDATWEENDGVFNITFNGLTRSIEVQGDTLIFAGSAIYKKVLENNEAN